MRDWDAARIARAAGAGLLAEPSRAASDPGPGSAAIDSRRLAGGELFVGLRGERLDGGIHAVQALRAGAWGVLVAPEHAQAALEADTGGAVLAHEDPLAGMQALARRWRVELRARGARVVAITGSAGKTSTKDILAALLAARMRVAASLENFNTEIGMPLAILAAPGDVEALVLEMAMRGSGQIAELTAIADPDVAVIVNVGPAHLEQLGSLEAIAAAKAELIAGLAPGTSVVVPVREPLLAAHLRADVDVTTFGDDADVSLIERRGNGTVLIRDRGQDMVLRPSFEQAHNLRNLLAAVAAARALGHTPEGRVEVRFSNMRGQRLVLPDGVVLIDDCYNANSMSMRAAIDDLAETAPGRRVAVLGDMLELGADSPRLHREIGEHASDSGVGLLITVGPLAGEMSGAFAGEVHSVADAPAAAEVLARLLHAGDTVLVKGSRGVGLEGVVAALAGPRATTRESARGASVLAPGAGTGRR